MTRSRPPSRDAAESGREPVGPRAHGQHPERAERVSAGSIRAAPAHRPACATRRAAGIGCQVFGKLKERDSLSSRQGLAPARRQPVPVKDPRRSCEIITTRGRETGAEPIARLDALGGLPMEQRVGTNTPIRRSAPVPGRDDRRRRRRGRRGRIDRGDRPWRHRTRPDRPESPTGIRKRADAADRGQQEPRQDGSQVANRPRGMRTPGGQREQPLQHRHPERHAERAHSAADRKKGRNPQDRKPSILRSAAVMHPSPLDALGMQVPPGIHPPGPAALSAPRIAQ